MNKDNFVSACIDENISGSEARYSHAVLLQILGGEWDDRIGEVFFKFLVIQHLDNRRDRLVREITWIEAVPSLQEDDEDRLIEIHESLDMLEMLRGKILASPSQ